MAENVCQRVPSYWIGRVLRPYDVGLVCRFRLILLRTV